MSPFPCSSSSLSESEYTTAGFVEESKKSDGRLPAVEREQSRHGEVRPGCDRDSGNKSHCFVQTACNVVS